MTNRSLLWRREGRLWIVVHTADSPSNLEWARFINDSRAVPPGAEGRILVVSHGGGPDSNQRKALADAIKEASPTVVMTSSVLLRGLGIAFAYFNRNMCAVALEDYNKAFDFLGLSPEEGTAARRIRRELERELGLDR